MTALCICVSTFSWFEAPLARCSNPDEGGKLDIELAIKPGCLMVVSWCNGLGLPTSGLSAQF